MKFHSNYHVTQFRLMCWVYITHHNIHYCKSLSFFLPPAKLARIQFLKVKFWFAMYTPNICGKGISTELYHPSITK
jgi:hypothetical protein